MNAEVKCILHASEIISGTGCSHENRDDINGICSLSLIDSLLKKTEIRGHNAYVYTFTTRTNWNIFHFLLSYVNYISEIWKDFVEHMKESIVRPWEHAR